MSPDVVNTLFGTCIGVGLLIGGCVALFNSWMP